MLRDCQNRRAMPHLCSDDTDSPRVTVVITSCNRQDLLARAMSSFFEFNTYPHVQVVVIEDGNASRNRRLIVHFTDHPVSWLSTGRRVGQIRAIDHAYSRISTPFIFHMEDDWQFHAGGFIEKSLQILRTLPDCLQVQIRALDDLNGHPLYEDVEFAGSVPFRRLVTDHQVGEGDQRYLWHGFSFNPGLRRLADYRRIGSYGAHAADARPGSALRAEEALGAVFRDLGYYAVALADNEGRGYVRHIGDNRHVHDLFANRVRRKWRQWVQAALVPRLR